MMDESSVPTTPLAGQKRSHGSVDGKEPQSPLNTAASSILTPISSTPSPASSVDLNATSRQGSPVRSVTSSAPTSTSNPNGPPAKKRKLTFEEKQAEKLAKKVEREEKERRKAEEKARREEEKRARDEERRRKEEEKEVVRRQKDLEKAEKEKAKEVERQAREEKKKKEEEEKQKKERSQLKLGSFFSKATTPVKPTLKATATTPSAAPSGLAAGNSLEPSNPSTADDSSNVVQSPSKKVKADFKVTFFPYEPPSNTVVAPYVRCHRDKKALENDLGNIDSALKEPVIEGVDVNTLTVFRSAPFARRRRGGVARPVREIVSKINGSATAPIDLTGESSNIRDRFRGISLKVLSFKEDVRPPYKGTYSRIVSPKSKTRLSRKPFTRALPDTNYDYDSEAEWEPPQEGDEDLLSEDDDEEDEDEDDLEGFLDDEDDSGLRKQHLSGLDLQPISTGLVWADRSHSVVRGFDLDNMRIDVITDEHRFPIDPFSTKYWETEEPAPHSRSKAMQPPSRSPLTSAKPTSAVFNQGTLVPVVQTSEEQSVSVKAPTIQTGQRGRPPKDPSRPTKMISSDLLPDFKQAVSGSNLSKAGLIEVLKKQFPKVAKDVIKDTLTAVASREGVKEADKIWVLI